MDKYISKLKELSSNFSYYEFINILKELDDKIASGELYQIKSEFIYYFKQIINMINDKYIVDGSKGTLGHMLVENALLNKKKLTPTLSLCFFLEQKKI